MSNLFDGYQHTAAFDEMFEPSGTVRAPYREFARRMGAWSADEFRARQASADLELMNSGITFTVYQDEAGTERIFPFSLVPRIVAVQEWAAIERGLVQRITALNRFLVDIYGDQHCVHDGVIPPELVEGHPGFNRKMRGFRPPLGVYAHIAGIDLIRCSDGRFRVLEDNLRTPSGVSYVIENRRTMLNVVPELFPAGRVRPVDEYPERLLEMMIAVRPEGVAADEAKPVILTPGPYNSAYFEHSFLARQTGVELVEGRDLLVYEQRVYVRATTGLERVHVIYRRIDDDFLDPDAFNPDSLLGVPGLVQAYRAGNVTLVNAIGNGIADDKITYRFVPDLIRYYTGEEPVIDNIETWVGIHEDDRRYMIDHVGDLVIKPADGSGGYGIVVGPQASKAQLEEARERIAREPRRWIAQPLQDFSTIPSFDGQIFEPRRVDLRPFVITGGASWVLAGGLTRVAPNAGSYIVNSSQGGGSKDTWVLRGDAQQAAGERGGSQQ